MLVIMVNKQLDNCNKEDLSECTRSENSTGRI